MRGPLQNNPSSADVNGALPQPYGAPSQVPAKDSQLPFIPDYELLRLIASGAYGKVWLARNVVGTLRAVKIVRRNTHESSESFDREFKGLQKFDPVSRAHEGLVDILTLGLLEDGAGFYYVMELADNAGESEEDSNYGAYTARTLRADLKRRSALPADEVLVLGMKLTAALAYLNSRGLVHRDIKPSNILFIGSEPKLADAGLVAAVDDARSLVGTFGYIAPEGPGTPQADLYALGKALYEAAFGKDRQDFPALPANIESRADHARLLELNALLLKACASDPRERYGSAQEMHSDFDFLHAGGSIRRLYAWRKLFTHAKKLGLAAGAIIIVAWLLIAFPKRQTRLPDTILSTNDEANEEFRKGILFLHGGGSSVQAIEHFQRATELDPNFTDAYSYLARGWIASSGTSSQMANARRAAEKAVSLNPNSALANSSLATVKLLCELDWAGAEVARARAVALAPDSEDILLTSALNLATMGRTKDALADLAKGGARAPTSPFPRRKPY
jgi:serine/threonine protein kinase